MRQIFPDETLIPALERWLPTALYYWLYENDVTPGYDSVFADFDVNSGTTYAVLSNGDFTLNSLTGHVARKTAADVSIQNNTGGTHNFYGYFVTTGQAGSSEPDGALILAARFDSAPMIVADGAFVPITPTVALKAPIP